MSFFNKLRPVNPKRLFKVVDFYSKQNFTIHNEHSFRLNENTTILVRIYKTIDNSNAIIGDPYSIYIRIKKKGQKPLVIVNNTVGGYGRIPYIYDGDWNKSIKEFILKGEEDIKMKQKKKKQLEREKEEQEYLKKAELEKKGFDLDLAKVYEKELK